MSAEPELELWLTVTRQACADVLHRSLPYSWTTGQREAAIASAREWLLGDGARLFERLGSRDLAELSRRAGGGDLDAAEELLAFYFAPRATSPTEGTDTSDRYGIAC